MVYLLTNNPNDDLEPTSVLKTLLRFSIESLKSVKSSLDSKMFLLNSKFESQKYLTPFRCKDALYFILKVLICLPFVVWYDKYCSEIKPLFSTKV